MEAEISELSQKQAALRSELSHVRSQKLQEAEEVRGVLQTKSDTIQELERETSVLRELEHNRDIAIRTRDDLAEELRNYSRREEQLLKNIEDTESRITRSPERIKYNICLL